ncbi:MAG: 3-deoxy-manno-octulosonate cytidylyltransferase [Chlorobia bacterium]|nr:3-deoxy-manno-octulosonate cytidylyltransferase [Fimbriimonadaceae bacterium]
MQCAIVIPARMASTRFPGKPLIDLCGKPMIQWAYEAALASGVTSQVVIATPDAEIAEAAEAFGARAFMTRLDHPSGTDRLAEVAESLKADFYVNVQGDEPLIDPETIRACAQPLRDDASLQMSSVFSSCPDEEVENPAVVKVVTDRKGNALYFSRHPIPYPRNPGQTTVKKHIGIYAYRHDVLLQFAGWAPTPLEQTESLEQLRFLENGVEIRMVEGKGTALAVDTPEQAIEVARLLAQRLTT